MILFCDLAYPGKLMVQKGSVLLLKPILMHSEQIWEAQCIFSSKTGANLEVLHQIELCDITKIP